MFTSFFSKAWFTICMCLIYFLSSLLFYYSFTMISKRYTLVVRLWFAFLMKAMTAFVAGIASFVLSLFSLNQSSSGARGFLAVEFVIIFSSSYSRLRFLIRSPASSTALRVFRPFFESFPKIVPVFCQCYLSLVYPNLL